MGQSVHDCAPGSALYLPAAQALQTALLEEDAYLPAAQTVHSLFDFPLANLPGSQEAHFTVLSLKVQAPHPVHTVPSVLPSLIVPSLQSRHAFCPVVSMYFPISHLLHAFEPTVGAM